MYGPLNDEEERTIRQEINQLYNSPDIITVMKAVRLYWTGDIKRMTDTEIPTELWSTI